MKDKDNLLKYNVWSGGEYNNTVDQYSSNRVIEGISESYSYIGTKSILIKESTVGVSGWIRFPYKLSSADVGKTATVKAKVYVQSNPCSTHILLNDNVISTAIVYHANKWVEVSLSTEILEDYDYVKINFKTNGSPVYVDNISITIQ